MGSLQEILESLLLPPPQISFTPKETVSFRKLLVFVRTLLQIFIKSWFGSYYVLRKPGFHFLVT